MRRTPRPFLVAACVVGLPMLLLGFVIGWLGGTGKVPLVGQAMAALGPGFGASPVMPADLGDEFVPFWEAWNALEREYYHPDELSRTAMIRGAINGMLASTGDPYTVYQEPDLAAMTNDYMQGSSGGIGAYLRLDNGRAFIDKVIPRSPAERASLQAQDEITHIDGKEVAQLTAGQDINKATITVTTLVRGPKGSTVTLTIRRGEQPPFDVALVRDEIVISSVKSQMATDTIGYIQITDFKATTAEDVDLALEALLPQASGGLVLDLRNNPGGYLDEARKVLGRFYNGTALFQRRRDGSDEEMQVLSGSVRAFDVPLVVLVNGNSASASEIVAGGLHDRRPGTTIIGEKTFGKGSVQNIFRLSDTGSARITVAQWLTPAKTVISHVGIVPDVVIPYNEESTSAVPCVAERAPAAGQSQCADSQFAEALRRLQP